MEKEEDVQTLLLHQQFKFKAETSITYQNSSTAVNILKPSSSEFYDKYTTRKSQTAVETLPSKPVELRQPSTFDILARHV